MSDYFKDSPERRERNEKMIKLIEEHFLSEIFPLYGEVKGWEKFWDWLLENIDVNLSIKYKPNSPCFDMRELLERKHAEYQSLESKANDVAMGGGGLCTDEAPPHNSKRDEE